MPLRLRFALPCVLLAACRSPTTPPVPPSNAGSPTTDALSLTDAFAIDRAPVSCRAFEVHATSTDRTRAFSLRVRGEQHGLTAGTHRLDVAAASSGLELIIDELSGPLPPEPFCTDVGGPSQPALRTRWTATSGAVIVTLSDDAQIQRPFVVDVELDDVVFTDPTGDTRTIDDRFDDLRVGWVPG